LAEQLNINALFYPNFGTEYRLIDCGNKRKLEQFGAYILIRPEPQAIWPAALSEKDWHAQAHAEFIRNPKSNTPNESEGGWKFIKKIPSEWLIRYPSEKSQLKAILKMTGFGHVGIFPEQAHNWDTLLTDVKKDDKVLNLFAYTGVSSIAAATKGAQVTHVDSVKNVVNWAADNMRENNLQDIRWIVEDAFKYVAREVTRQKQYDFIILDPPAYGRGPKGEKWILEDKLDELMQMVRNILAPKGQLILNLYSLGYSPLLCYNLLKHYFPNQSISSGELCIRSEAGQILPLSVFGKVS
jgi:23S rRNA (cytosine1962-C5)-methyltransferase